jgi:hypothetical protein
MQIARRENRHSNPAGIRKRILQFRRSRAIELTGPSQQSNAIVAQPSALAPGVPMASRGPAERRRA